LGCDQEHPQLWENYVSEMDIGSKSQQDEDWEQRWENDYDEIYEVSWHEVWLQQLASGILRSVRDVSMVGQLGHFRTRQ
jgi:hypothetical protein